MYDIVALGEALIDFTPSGSNELGMELFARNPGGAPANVLAMYNKLGGKTAFIGKVGRDSFGLFLTHTMQLAGIDTTNLVYAEDVPTTLAFVHLDSTGNRSFSFYRKPGADVCLTPQEVNEDVLNNCRVFHFGSVSLTDDPCRTATLQSAEKAKRAGALISFDPNYRPHLWRNEQAALSEIKNGLRLADIVKVSDEEMLLLTGETDLQRGAGILLAYGPALVVVTMAEKGAFCKTREASMREPAFDVQAVDTTGAGDAFWGTMLFYLRGKDRAQLQSMQAQEMKKILRYANAAGGLTVTKKGAIPAMPDKDTLQKTIFDVIL